MALGYRYSRGPVGALIAGHQNMAATQWRAHLLGSAASEALQTLHPTK